MCFYDGCGHGDPGDPSCHSREGGLASSCLLYVGFVALMVALAAFGPWGLLVIPVFICLYKATKETPEEKEAKRQASLKQMEKDRREKEDKALKWSHALLRGWRSDLGKWRPYAMTEQQLEAFMRENAEAARHDYYILGEMWARDKWQDFMKKWRAERERREKNAASLIAELEELKKKQAAEKAAQERERRKAQAELEKARKVVDDIRKAEMDSRLPCWALSMENKWKADCVELPVWRSLTGAQRQALLAKNLERAKMDFRKYGEAAAQRMWREFPRKYNDLVMKKRLDLERLMNDPGYIAEESLRDEQPGRKPKTGSADEIFEEISKEDLVKKWLGKKYLEEEEDFEDDEEEEEQRMLDDFDEKEE